MNTPAKNKQFLKRYYREMHIAKDKDPESFNKAISIYIKDQKLIDHIKFFNQSFPGYRIRIKDMLAENDKVFVSVNFIGIHNGTDEGIPSTQKTVEIPFALCYTIRNEKIIDFWAIANEMEFFDQLGLSEEQVNVQKTTMSKI